MKPSTTFVDSIAPAPDASADTIRVRAFELYEARGGDPGHDIDDWLQAENELRRAGSVVHA